MNASRSLPLDEAPLLEAERLALQVGERWLCCEFSLSLAAGECLVLLGPNGAGKTTLLHTLAGLREPSVGAVRLGGLPYAAWSAQDAARYRGVLLQQQPDHFAASVLETVLIGRHPHLGRWGWEGPEDERICRAALQDVGLAGFEHRGVLTLSGGERQRVAVATLLAQAPRLFLLDEPLNHLDLRYQIAVLELFRRQAVQRGSGVVMVLHDINLAARYADHIILLDGRGGVVAGGRDTVLRADCLSHAFGHALRRYDLDGRITFIPE
ncbi:ATP-binding cassette domain-containing protein [Azoarcus communis]|uniref:ABC transporter ATP-binding protein n=1 Tax=Parazoarcus communis TaxID=41977 RepID=UPI001459427D|nr:ABC transporter ATP-binding protein [Parazoarcus communis]NMG47609.1 ATP-binding cassette domain-containing protein [Parazoarcus communis]